MLSETSLLWKAAEVAHDLPKQLHYWLSPAWAVYVSQRDAATGAALLGSRVGARSGGLPCFGQPWAEVRWTRTATAAFPLVSADRLPAPTLPATAAAKRGEGRSRRWASKAALWHMCISVTGQIFLEYRKILYWALVLFLPVLFLFCIISHLSLFTEKPRGGQLRENTKLGTRSLAFNHLHCSQHWAAFAFLQCTQPSF